MPPQKGVKVRLGSPLGIVDHAGAICTFVQCYPDHARLILYLFSKASPLIEQRLLLLGRRLKDIDQRDQIPLFGNKHLFSPLMYCSIDGPCLIVLTPERDNEESPFPLVWGDAHGSNTVGGPVDDWRVGLASPPIGKLDHQPRP